jgi:hypothetical protein
VAVGLGSDGIRDLWSPWGDGDLLARAALLAWRAGARRDQDLAAALEVATSGGAAVLNLPAYGLTPGCTADLSLVPATTLGEAVVTHPPTHPAPWSSSPAASCDCHDNTDRAHVPCVLHQAPLAQSAEHIHGKDGVAGSIPAGGSTPNQQLRPGLVSGLLYA